MGPTRILIAAGLIALVTGLTGCATNTPGTEADPAQVSEQFLRALADGDCKEVKGLVAMPSAIDCEWVAEASNSGDLTQADLDETEFTVVDEGGGSAMVEVAYPGDSGAETTTTNLVKTDGKWRVLFDSEE